MNATLLIGAAIVFGTAALQPARAQTTELERILDRTATYLGQYEQDLKSIVLEENYLQRVTSEDLKRTLRSDLVIVSDPKEGWIELRDVLEVDGRALDDHTERIVALLSKPMRDAMLQARRVADESARFNLGPRRGGFQRTINVPFTALRFLRRANQQRSVWQLDRSESVGDRTASVIRFEERTSPGLIGSKQRIAARGTFWIGDDGAVLRSDLRTLQPIVSSIRVSYTFHRELKLWLPETMDEEYRFRTNSPFVTSVDGRAVYSNARQFKVDTSMSVK